MAPAVYNASLPPSGGIAATGTSADTYRSRSTGTGTTDLRDVSLRASQVIVAVEEVGLRADAAKRLAGSRSSVSRHITKLEAIVGAPIFDCGTRLISTTPIGRVVRRPALRILHALGETRSDAMGLARVSLIELRLSILDERDASVAPELVSDMRALSPLPADGDFGAFGRACHPARCWGSPPHISGGGVRRNAVRSVIRPCSQLT